MNYEHSQYSTNMLVLSYQWFISLGLLCMRSTRWGRGYLAWGIVQTNRRKILGLRYIFLHYKVQLIPFITFFQIISIQINVNIYMQEWKKEMLKLCQEHVIIFSSSFWSFSLLKRFLQSTTNTLITNEVKWVFYNPTQSKIISLIPRSCYWHKKWQVKSI